MQGLLRVALLVYVALLAVPLRFFPIEAGLDPSWAFALKWFNSRGLKYGHDLAFTWGPLGHLAIAMDVNGGLGTAVAAQIAGWTVFVSVMAYMIFRKQVHLWRLIAFVALTYAGVRMFHTFGYAGFDFFLSWLVLLLIGCSAVERRWWIPFGTAVALAGLLMLMKFSTGIAAGTAALAYPAGSVFIDRSRALKTGAIAVVGLPLVFMIGYLAHLPSFSAMTHYLRAGFEISSEHSTILSLSGDPVALYLALALFACYAIFAAVLLRNRNPGFPLVLATLGPLFLEFKHSFIREAGHVEMLFLFSLLVAAALVLFIHTTGRSRSAVAITATLFVAISCYAERNTIFLSRTGLEYALPLTEIARWDSLRNRLKQQSEANLAIDRLPPELLARVQGQSVTIFPWESSYAAANTLDYRPFPIFQSYDAYTPFLDRWNADFFANKATAPDFVIFDWAAIDERHPLLDVPQTALELYRNYVVDGTFGTHILLRRLAESRFVNSPTKVREGTMRVGEKLTVSAGTQASMVKLYLKWNVEGAVRKFFWRLPEVRWVAIYGDGGTVSARIPPAVVAGGVAVDLIPANPGRLRELYSGHTPLQADSIVIAGEAVRYLASEARYELYQFEPVSVVRAALPAISPAPGLRGDCAVDFVNNSPVEGGNVTAAAPDGLVVIRGWALSGPEVLLRVNNQLRRPDTALPRPDVVAAYRQDAGSRPGFELTVPAAELSPGNHQIEALVKNSAGSYQNCAETVRLKLN